MAAPPEGRSGLPHGSTVPVLDGGSSASWRRLYEVAARRLRLPEPGVARGLARGVRRHPAARVPRLHARGARPVAVCALRAHAGAPWPVSPPRPVHQRRRARTRASAAPSSATTFCAPPGVEPAVAPGAARGIWTGRGVGPRSWPTASAPDPSCEALDAVAFADLRRDRPRRDQLLRGPGASARDGADVRRRAEPQQALAGPQVRPHVRVPGAAPHRDRAETPPTPRRCFDQLIALHQRSWTRPRLIAERLPRRARSPSTATLIARAFAPGRRPAHPRGGGAHTVGILYNFVRHGRIDFYQSGFNYQEGFRPGYVTFATALRYYLDHGFRQFDFLAGDQQYKQSLSTDVRELVWAVLPARQPQDAHDRAAAARPRRRRPLPRSASARLARGPWSRRRRPRPTPTRGRWTSFGSSKRS